MRKKKPSIVFQRVLCAGILFLICQNLFSAQFQEVNTRFDRRSSRVMIRKIIRPTLANLDFAAYTGNPVRYDPQTFKPKAPANKIGPADCSFGEALSRQCSSLQSTPLTPAEIEHAMAWEPLVKKLWELFKTDGFSNIGNAVMSEKWADPSVFMPYQEIVAAYAHGSGDSAELWVKIEFKPWVHFLRDIADENKDGFKEIYGRVVFDKIDKKIVRDAFDWTQSEYTKKELSKEEAIDWANTLASYWYPKLNTDILDMTGQTVWPNNATEPAIKKELKGQKPVKPLVVIRGNPFGKPMYNVFIVDYAEQKTVSLPADTTVQSKTGDTTAMEDVSQSYNYKANMVRFSQEINENGDYAKWGAKDAAWRKGLVTLIQALPPGQLGFTGKDGWIFFTKGVEYLNAGDLNAQPPDKNPLPRLVEFKKYLAVNKVSLLFVVVPEKAEVYFEKLPGKAPADAYSIVNPYSRKFLKDAQDSGIEVIDLLPLFLAAKRDDAGRGEIYQKQDAHWTARGLDIAAETVSARIKAYGWYAQAAKNPVNYVIKDTFFTRQGDIVDKLAEKDRTSYPPVQLKAKQVFCPDGKLYKPSNPQAPLLLIGDSFTGVFELIDCKGAGVGAHIAAKTGIPVDIITSWGGGPLVRDKMVRARQKDLPYKRVVIYLMAARDLYNYSQGWEPLNAK